MLDLQETGPFILSRIEATVCEHTESNRGQAGEAGAGAAGAWHSAQKKLPGEGL